MKGNYWVSMDMEHKYIIKSTIKISLLPDVAVCITSILGIEKPQSSYTVQYSLITHYLRKVL